MRAASSPCPAAASAKERRHLPHAQRHIRAAGAGEHLAARHQAPQPRHVAARRSINFKGSAPAHCILFPMGKDGTRRISQPSQSTAISGRWRPHGSSSSPRHGRTAPKRPRATRRSSPQDRSASSTARAPAPPAPRRAGNHQAHMGHIVAPLLQAQKADGHVVPVDGDAHVLGRRKIVHALDGGIGVQISEIASRASRNEGTFGIATLLERRQVHFVARLRNGARLPVRAAPTTSSMSVTGMPIIMRLSSTSDEARHHLAAERDVDLAGGERDERRLDALGVVARRVEVVAVPV